MPGISSVFLAVINRIAQIPEVKSIGRSGGRALPATSADGDIDVFLYCDGIPPEESRRAMMLASGEGLTDVRLSANTGGRWGTADFARIGGVELWLMYFTRAEAEAEVMSYLRGDHPGREGNFYPTGRLAMFLNMEILLDRAGFLAGLKERLSDYPEALSRKLTARHLDALRDTEDFERAVARRDPLFYHFALEIALDHFLQALFAMNRVYFPSRKRSLEHIALFDRKPIGCEERLLEVIRLGGMPDGIEPSYLVWKNLVGDLTAVAPVK